MPLILPNDLANGQPADGDRLQQNFSTIEDYTNAELIRRDGQVAMTGPLLLPTATPTQPNQAVSKSYVDAAGPIGSVLMYAGLTAPNGYLFCRGQAVSRSTYAALFTVIGTRFGSGDGSTTFNLPNYQGTVPVGFNSGTNPPPGVTGKFTAGVGERIGQTDNTLVAHSHNTASHYHDMNNHTHRLSAWSGNENQSHYHGASLGELLQTSNSPGYYLDTFPAADVGIGYAGTGWANQSHAHYLDANTGGPSIATTGYNVGQGTDTQGVTGVNANIQPSLTINFLIKVT